MIDTLLYTIYYRPFQIPFVWYEESLKIPITTKKSNPLPYTSPPNTNMITINDNGNPDLGWDRYNSVVVLNWLIGCQHVLTSIHLTDDEGFLPRCIIPINFSIFSWSKALMISTSLSKSSFTSFDTPSFNIFMATYSPVSSFAKFWPVRQNKMHCKEIAIVQYAFMW